MVLGKNKFDGHGATAAIAPVRRASRAPRRLVARALQCNSGLIAAVGVVGIPALVATGHEIFAIDSTIVGAIAPRVLHRARCAPADQGAGGRATAEAIAHIMVVHTASDEVRLEVAPPANRFVDTVARSSVEL